MTTAEMLQLENFESVKRWETRLNRKSGSPNTRDAFFGWLSQFCTFVNLDPDQLISERQDDLKSEDVFVKKRAEDRLDRWFSELEKQEYARNTCVQAYASVRSFYKANHLPLEVGEPVQRWPVKEQREFTREHLRQLLDASKKDKQRTVIMCEAQSGLGVSDLLGIIYGQVRPQLDEGKDHIHLRLLRGKEKQIGYFDTFFGAQAVDYLRKYIESRKGLRDEDRLFQISPRGYNKVLETLSKRAKLPFIVSTHLLRKFFNTYMKLGANETYVEYWMGHSLSGVRGEYLNASPAVQLEKYKQAEPNITV